MPVFHWSLDCDDSAPRRARTWVAERLRHALTGDGAQGEDLAHDAMLCVSELVTAALLADASTMSLRLQIEPDFVRLSLRDDSSPVSERGEPLLRAQYLGLRTIEAVTDRWGVDTAGGERELWALFTRPHAAGR